MSKKKLVAEDPEGCMVGSIDSCTSFLLTTVMKSSLTLSVKVHFSAYSCLMLYCLVIFCIQALLLSEHDYSVYCDYCSVLHSGSMNHYE